MFFVMGESFFCESFSETKSGKRATQVEPRVSHEVCSRRFFCKQELRKMRCRYAESLFGRELRFFEPKKIAERLLRTTWGGRWSAIDSLCEALFVNFFPPRSISIPEAQMTPAALRSSASASLHFFELFSIILRKTANFHFPAFST